MGNPKCVKSKFSLKDIFRDGFHKKYISFGKDRFDIRSKYFEAKFKIFYWGLESKKISKLVRLTISKRMYIYIYIIVYFKSNMMINSKESVSLISNYYIINSDEL